MGDSGGRTPARMFVRGSTARRGESAESGDSRGLNAAALSRRERGESIVMDVSEALRSSDRRRSAIPSARVTL